MECELNPNLGLKLVTYNAHIMIVRVGICALILGLQNCVPHQDLETHRKCRPAGYLDSLCPCGHRCLFVCTLQVLRGFTYLANTALFVQLVKWLHGLQYQEHFLTLVRLSDVHAIIFVSRLNWMCLELFLWQCVCRQLWSLRHTN